MINKDRENFQYRRGDLVYIISPLTSQLRTNSWKTAVKYVCPVVVYKIVDPHNYLLMTLDGIILKKNFEHMRIKPAVIRTSHGNVQNLTELMLCKAALAFCFDLLLISLYVCLGVNSLHLYIFLDLHCNTQLLIFKFSSLPNS